MEKFKQNACNTKYNSYNVLTLRRAQMHVNQVIKFNNPTDAAEAALRFTVLELRGDRVLVEAICNMNLKPTFAYMFNELEVVK